MAELENIRKRGPLIAIVIGFALLAFILGDINQLFSGSSSNYIAEINGNSIDIQDYQKEVNGFNNFFEIGMGANTSNEEQTKRNLETVWGFIVRTNILNDNYEAVNLDVTGKEVASLTLGENNEYSPLMYQLNAFKNPSTGQFDPVQARNFFNADLKKNREYKDFSDYLENLIRDEKLFEKYFTLAQKGMYVTSLEAKMLNSERTNMFDFEYVFLKYADIPDSTISVGEDEISKYYSEHKKEYEQEHTRDIAYTLFNVLPLKEDYEKALNDIKKEKLVLSEFDKDSVNNIIEYSNTVSSVPVNSSFLRKDEVRNPYLDTLIFEANTGDIFGPYQDVDKYKVTRLLGKKMRPDTVDMQFILIGIDGQRIADDKKAKFVADSIYNRVKAGDNFDELAKKHSMHDFTAEKGGKFDQKITEQVAEQYQLPESFKNFIFDGKAGDLKLIKDQNVYFVVKVLSQTKAVEKVRFVTIEKLIEPGTNTKQAKKREAKEFATKYTSAEEIEKACDENNLNYSVVDRLNPSTQVISGINNPSQIISWAFREKTEKGSLSKVYDDGNKFVYAVVTEIREEGIAPIEQVKDEIITILRKEKKGEILAEKLKETTSSNGSLSEIAAKSGGQFDIAKNISFSSFAIPKVGAEPSLIAQASLTPKDKTTEPIIGENGVFIIKITTITGNANIDEKAIESDRTNAERRLKLRAYNPRGMNFDAYEALKKSADIKDFRYKF